MVRQFKFDFGVRGVKVKAEPFADVRALDRRALALAAEDGIALMEAYALVVVAQDGGASRDAPRCEKEGFDFTRRAIAQDHA